MNRILFEAGELDADGRVKFGGIRADHVVGVLRAEVGRTVKTGVVNGAVGTAEIERIEGERARSPELVESASLRITVRCRHDGTAVGSWADLILALPRPRALKRLLPQLAAMGVGDIVLVGAQKTEKAYWGAQILRPEIHRPLLVEGLMQGGISELPRIAVRRNLRQWLTQGDFEDRFPAGSRRRVLAHPDGSGRVNGGGADGGRRPLLAVGPEGGWTDEELQLLEARGFGRLSLGPRILRTDTACVALLARLMP